MLNRSPVDLERQEEVREAKARMDEAMHDLIRLRIKFLQEDLEDLGVVDTDICDLLNGLHAIAVIDVRDVELSDPAKRLVTSFSNWALQGDIPEYGTVVSIIRGNGPLLKESLQALCDLNSESRQQKSAEPPKDGSGERRTSSSFPTF